MTLPLLVAFALLLAAFSTGSPLFLTSAVLILLLCLSSVIAVLQTVRTLTVSGALSERVVQRGEDVQMEVVLRCRSLIPIAPLELELSGGLEKTTKFMTLEHVPRAGVSLELPFHAAHVGLVRPGVAAVTVSDLFGICSRRVVPRYEGNELVVMPTPFEVGEQIYAAGESGSESMARAAEDITSPADVRTYQQGDAMKKIHWKLSMRKQELMVRRFEAPVMPDALVLMDCMAPDTGEDREAQADLKDALLETAASVMAENVRTDHPARLPLMGEHPMELDKGMGMPAILEALAHVDFSADEPFERVLQLELRRMRKVGSTIVITTRLNGRIVDRMAAMRRMGPYVRLYLATFTPEAEEMAPMISRLQNAGVEVCYVTPLAM